MTKNTTKDIQVKYEDFRGNELVLTGKMVKEYISTDPNVSTKEIVMFLSLAKFLRLNPFLKEIYLVKYGNQPAQYIISWHALLVRADKNPNFDGYEVTVKGEIPNMTATCKVYRKDRSHPTVVEVDYNEAVKMKWDDRLKKYVPQSSWATMPKWMLRKVAVARAIKEAFPDIVGANVGVSVSGSEDPDKPPKEVELTEEEIKEGIDALYGGEVVMDTTETEAEKPEAKTETDTDTKEIPPEEKPSPSLLNAIEVKARKKGDLAKLAMVRRKIKEGLTKEEAKKLYEELG